MSATKEITRVNFTATGIPEGLGVSTTGEVSGTPTGEEGNHPVAVEVTTNYGKATGSITVTVEASEPTDESQDPQDPQEPQEPDSENP